MGWAGHVARVGEESVCEGSWWGNRREGDQWADLGVDGWIILRWISRRWDVGIWTGLGWPGIGIKNSTIMWTDTHDARRIRTSYPTFRNPRPMYLRQRCH